MKVNIRKIIAIILIISVLAGLLAIGASAMLNTPNVIPITGVNYIYEHTLCGTHRTNGYDYNYASGSFGSYNILSFGSESVTATYQWSFEVSVEGNYCVSHDFTSSANITQYQIRVIDNELGGAIYRFIGNDTKVGRSTQNIGVTLMPNHSYTIVLNFYKADISFYDPWMNYKCQYGISYSSSGDVANIDVNKSVSDRSKLVLERIDLQGRYWYRYNGLTYSQKSTGIDSYIDNSTTNNITVECIDSASVSSSLLGFLYDVDLYVELPKTGNYTMYWEVDYIDSFATLSTDNHYNTIVQLVRSYGASSSAKYTFTSSTMYNVSVPVPGTTIFGFEGQSMPIQSPWNNVFIQFQPRIGTTTIVQNFRMYYVCEPLIISGTFGGYSRNYTLEGTDIGVNDIITITDGVATITLPIDGVLTEFISSDYYYDVENHQFHFTTADGTVGVITFTGNGITYVIKPPEDDPTAYFANFEGVGVEGTDGTGIETENPAPDGYESSGGKTRPQSDPFNLWNWLKELIASILEGVFNIVKAIIEGLFSLITQFFVGAIEKLVAFFDVFNPANGALDFFGEGSSFEWSIP